MIIRPQRFRILIGFILGLAISFILSGLVYATFGSSAFTLKEEEKIELQKKAVEDYLNKNPIGIVYVAAEKLEAGVVLADKDLIPAEINLSIIPEDAISDLASAIGKVVRCDLNPNTLLTHSLLYGNNEYPDDVRLMEYTVIHIPQKLEANQYVDIRIMFPNGLDYIVLSKKRVIDLMKPEENQQSALWLQSGEEEILRMASAIVDASIVENTILYAVPYIAPDIQKEAAKTYPSNPAVQKLIQENPNIVHKAISELEERNRQIFENRINSTRQEWGKSKIYGEEPVDTAVKERLGY